MKQPKVRIYAGSIFVMWMLVCALFVGLSNMVENTKASTFGMDSNLSDSQASFLGEDAGDFSGASVAIAGDVNGDGFDDILIGAYQDEESNTWAGQTYLIFGKPSGWTRDMSLSSADASFVGEDENDWSGYSVAGAGDVNGDGFDDILIGAYKDEDGGTEAGQTYLILGKASGWMMRVNLSNADASFIGEEANDQSGFSVAGAGDVNGDGYDDILIGAPGNDESIAEAGQTYVIFGMATGWAMDTNLSNADASFLGEAFQDASGWSVAGSGDVNGDGFDDILIGAIYNDQGGSNRGQTYLILGKATGWTNDISLTNASASFWGESDEDRTGECVAGGGDVNGDGYDDILIGCFARNSGRGKAYLMYGKASGWTNDTLLSNSDASYLGEDTGDYSGDSVAIVGDVNSDGFDDILIGAPQDEEFASGAGQTYLVLGNATGGPTNMFLQSHAVASFFGEDSNDASGFAVAGGGDINGDGFDDLLIGAYGDEEAGGQAGQTYLIFFESLPTPPKSLNVILSVDATFINITWKEVEYYKNITSYIVYRSEDGITYHEVAVLNPDTFFYKDTDVICGRVYRYAVTTTVLPNMESPMSIPAEVLCDYDTDLDKIGNTVDFDDDGDGVSDGADAFPLDKGEWLDTDLDGIGNNADDDDDNDGIRDIEDAEPLNPLNNLETKIDWINNTVNDIQNRVADIQSDLGSMNLSDLQSAVDYLNQTLLPQMDALAQDLSGMNDSLLNRISDYETNILNDLTDVNASLANEIQNLLTSITSEITDINSSLSDQLTNLLNDMSTDNDALRNWLELVLGAIDTNLTTTKNTLQNQLSDLEDYVNGFNDTLQGDLGDISSAIQLHDESTGEDHSDIISQLDDLLAGGIGAEGIADLKTMLVNLAANLSDHSQSIADDILEVVNIIETFEEETDQRLEGINSTLDDLAKLQTILDDLNDLDSDLQSAQTSIDEIPKEKEEGEEFGITHSLLIVVIVLLIINLLVTLMGRKGETGGPRTLLEEETESKSTADEDKAEEPEEEEELEEGVEGELDEGVE